MSTRPISRLPLDDQLLNSAKAAGIYDTSDFFTLSEYHLIERLNITPIRLHDTLARIAVHIAPVSKTALELLDTLEGKTQATTPIDVDSAYAEPWFLPKRLEILLPSLRLDPTTLRYHHAPKGFYVGHGVVEIVGGSGTGKTQICHSLAIQAALSGLEGNAISSLVPGKTPVQDGVVYICSSVGGFSPQRAHQLINSYTGLPYNYLSTIRHEEWLGKSFENKSGTKPGVGVGGSVQTRASDHQTSQVQSSSTSDDIPDTTLQHVLSRIFVYNESDLPSLLARVRDLETLFVEQRVGLVIIDTLDALAMRPLSKVEPEKQAMERHVLLLDLAALLKQYGSLFGIRVVVANQLSLRAGLFAKSLGASSSVGITTAHSGTGISTTDDDDNDVSITQLLRQLVMEVRRRWAGDTNHQVSHAPLPVSLRLSGVLERIVGSKLGIGWSHAVTDRIALFALDVTGGDKQDKPSQAERVAVLVKSPSSAAHTIRFEIKDSGAHFVQ